MMAFMRKITDGSLGRSALPMLIIGLLLGGMEIHAQTLTLTRDGKAECVIVTPAIPNDGAAFAAQELQYHVKMVTGADVAVISDRAAIPDGMLPVYVGESAGTRKLGLSSADYKPQEYSLTFLTKAIVLMGRDEVQYPVVAHLSSPMGHGKFGRAWNPGWNCATVLEHGFDDHQGTMECFVYMPEKEGEVGTGMLIWGIGDGNNGQRLSVSRYDDSKDYGLVYETIVNGQSSKVVVGDAWANRKPGWHHVMCTWDAGSGEQHIYFNGVAMAPAAYVKTSCANAPAFGLKTMSDAVPYCVGPLDEVRLSNVVRKPQVPGKPYETDENTLLLMHFEDPNGFPYDSSGRPRAVKTRPARDGRLATMYAVYDFIEDYLGVQWYLPGELGMVYDEQTTLTVKGKDVRRTPAMACRSSTAGKIAHVEDEWGGKMQRILSDSPNGDDIELYSYRLRYGGPPMGANHSFYGYADRFRLWKANPKDERLKGYEDEVSLFEKGSLMAQGYEDPRQLCYSSDDAVAMVVKDARKYFDEGYTKPGANVGPDWFGLVPSDDGYWCKCSDCVAKLKYPDKVNGNNVPVFYGNGFESNASYLVWDFTRRVAEEIHKSHPSKFLGQLAYIEYLGVPVDSDDKPLEYPPNVILGVCLCSRPVLEMNPIKNGEIGVYKQWMGDAKKFGWSTCFWLYQCFPNEIGIMRKFNWWPGFHAHNLDKSMRMFVHDGLDGLFLCGIADYIDCWLTFRYMYNPCFDLEAELDEFFTRFYGPAARPMKEFYLLTEKQFLDPDNYPRSTGYQNTEYMTWSSLGAPPVMEKLKQLIKEARTLAKDGAYKKRVELFDEAVWRHMENGFNEWVGKQPGGQHSWPLRVTESLITQERGLPYFGRAYFRNRANPISLADPRFDDRKGTMEAAVWCGPVRPEFCQGPGTVFEIMNAGQTTGHRVRIDADMDKKHYSAIYETWVGAKTNRVVSAPLGTDQWHHVSAMWQAGKTGSPSGEGSMVLVVNHKVAGKKPYVRTSCATSGAFDIGAGVDGIGFGPIDEVRLSNVIRKPTKQTAPHTPDANTLLLLHFDEGEGEPVRDHSGISR